MQLRLVEDGHLDLQQTPWAVISAIVLHLPRRHSGRW